MKLTFECKLTVFDCIPDDEVRRVRTKEEVARAIAKCIENGLTEGGVSMTDLTLTREDGDDNGNG